MGLKATMGLEANKGLAPSHMTTETQTQCKTHEAPQDKSPGDHCVLESRKAQPRLGSPRVQNQTLWGFLGASHQLQTPIQPQKC
jgi:hypothetical protein